MAVNLIKMAVGVRDVAHLAGLQAARLEHSRRQGDEPVLRHVTRHLPRRAGDIADGGSLFWVIKGFVRVRQRIHSVERTVNSEGRPACALVIDPELVRTELRPAGPFQGWRYLKPEKTPPDAVHPEGDKDGVPEELATELRELGLL